MLKANFQWKSSTFDSANEDLGSIVRVDPADSGLASWHLAAQRTLEDPPFEITLSLPNQRVLKRISAISTAKKLNIVCEGQRRTLQGDRMTLEDLEGENVELDALPIVYEIEHLETDISTEFGTLKIVFDASELDLRLFVFDVDTGPILLEQKTPGTMFGNGLSLPKAGGGPDPSFLVPLLAGLRAKDEKAAAEDTLADRITKTFERTLDTRIAAFEGRIEKRLTRIETLLTQITDAKQIDSAPVDRPSWVPPGVSQSGPVSHTSYAYDSSQYWSSDAEVSRFRGSSGKDKEVQEMNELTFM